jgi:hypothetical protein
LNGGTLSEPITNPGGLGKPAFVALRGLVYSAGALYAVDGQNLNNETANPGVIWKVTLGK